jgi:DNA-binding MarR family transcriptional regulator
MMSDKQQRAAGLVVEVIPKIMRALASDWRHVDDRADPGHFRILLILTEGPANLSALAAKLEVSLPTMSNSISTLVERGWVARRRDPEDRRRVLIEITAQGCAVLERIRHVAQIQVERTLRDLTDVEYDQIIAGLDTLRRALDGEDSALCHKQA